MSVTMMRERAIRCLAAIQGLLSEIEADARDQDMKNRAQLFKALSDELDDVLAWLESQKVGGM